MAAACPNGGWCRACLTGCPARLGLAGSGPVGASTRETRHLYRPSPVAAPRCVSESCPRDRPAGFRAAAQSSTRIGKRAWGWGGRGILGRHVPDPGPSRTRVVSRSVRGGRSWAFAAGCGCFGRLQEPASAPLADLPHVGKYAAPRMTVHPVGNPWGIGQADA